MNNHWLIRTKSNYILGPISRQKLADLIASGAIGPDDEITSGNGYWIFVREKELVQKYLYDGVPQGFNPVSEAFNERVTREAAAAKARAQVEVELELESPEHTDRDDITVLYRKPTE